MSNPPGNESSSTPSEQPPTWPPPPPPVFPPSPPSAVESPTPTAVAPPVYGPPPTAPAPPTYDPTLVPVPYSAPPISGPYGYGIPLPPPPPKRRLTTVFAVLTALFLVATGVLGTLYVLKFQESTKQGNQVTQLTSENATQRDKLESTQRELDSTKRDLRDSDDELQDITAQKSALAGCLNAIYDYWDALDANNQRSNSTTEAARLKAATACDAAGKYL